jgi:hypothetical protein
MAQLQIICFLRAGMQERWRRLCQELMGSRRDQFVASCQQRGITGMQVRMVQRLRGEMLLVSLDVQEPHQPLQELVASGHPFDRWLREHLKILLGWTLQDIASDQQLDDLLMAWQGEQSQENKHTDNEVSL